MNTPHSHCKKGHPLEGRNLLVRDGFRRQCWLCAHRPNRHHRWVDGKCDICGVPSWGSEERYVWNFWQKVNKTETCWLWTATLYRNGYGQYGNPPGERRAHRISWLLAGNEIPAGMELDHLCHERTCVRPDHLEAVTHQENMDRRKNSGICTKGHSMAGDNRMPAGEGRSRCRACYASKLANARAARLARGHKKKGRPKKVTA